MTIAALAESPMSSRLSHTRPLVAALLSALVLGAVPAPAETQWAPKFVVNPKDPVATYCRALHRPMSPVKAIWRFANQPTEKTVDRLARGGQAVRSEIRPSLNLAALRDALEFGRVEVPLPEELALPYAMASNRGRKALDLALAINYAAYPETLRRKVGDIPHAAHPDAVALALHALMPRLVTSADERVGLAVLGLLHDVIEDNVHLALGSQQPPLDALQLIDPKLVPARLSLSERLRWGTAAARDALNEAFADLTVPGAGGVGDAVVFLTEPPSPHGFAGYVGLPEHFPGSKNQRQRTTRAAHFAELTARGGPWVAIAKLADLIVNADRLHVLLRHGPSAGLPLDRRLLSDISARAYIAGVLAKVPGVPAALRVAFDDMITEVMNTQKIVAVTGESRWCDMCRREREIGQFARANHERIRAHNDDYLRDLAALP